MTPGPKYCSKSQSLPMNPRVEAGLVSLVVSVCGTMLTHICLPLFKRWRLRSQLKVEVAENHGLHARLRVTNEGSWTVCNATAYLTLDTTRTDILSPTQHDAYISPRDFARIEEQQLHWAVHPNPMRLDICAKERTMLSPCRIHNDYIEILSENPAKARAFVTRRRYQGFVKIVSGDIDAVIFDLTIDPENTEVPFSVRRREY